MPVALVTVICKRLSNSRLDYGSASIVKDRRDHL
jgi:hypothetical protein